MNEEVIRRRCGRSISVSTDLLTKSSWRPLSPLYLHAR